jgi:hypothetical protein
MSICHPSAARALAHLIHLEQRADRIEFGGAICLAMAIGSSRSRIRGGRAWIRLGVVDLMHDCLRCHVPDYQRVDCARV